MLETICCCECMRITYAFLVPQSQTLHVTPMRIITAYFKQLTALERHWFYEHGNESSAHFKSREFLG
jgi:hypothetical protein